MAMTSSSDDISQLKQLITQTLTQNGTIAKLKAELRSSILQTIQQTPQTTKLARFKQSREGRLLLDLISEVLDFYQMTSSSVYNVESDATVNRQMIKEELRIEATSDEPLLLHLLRQFESSRNRIGTFGSKETLGSGTLRRNVVLSDELLVKSNPNIDLVPSGRKVESGKKEATSKLSQSTLQQQDYSDSFDDLPEEIESLSVEELSLVE